MNIELDEVVLQDVSDDALEMASGGVQAGLAGATFYTFGNHCKTGVSRCCAGNPHPLGY
jgi:predicted lipoprotein with Yx(FWY)xxD motif